MKLPFQVPTLLRMSHGLSVAPANTSIRMVATADFLVCKGRGALLDSY